MRRFLFLLLVLSLPLRLSGCYSGPRVVKGPLVDCAERSAVRPGHTSCEECEEEWREEV